ncbi:unnamed protein product, partial [Effrenium voratum]
AEPTLPGVGGSQDLASALAHPYEQELSAISWPDSFFEPRPAQRYPRVEDTPLVIVRSESQLREMIEEIKATCTGKEIAVDVEHHDQRSYRGFVCLIQVSTRNKDFLVDPFDIFEQMHLLNEIFSDPRILKVLHGADRDVMWLQRDFSVYLVNMFDTGLATRQLRLQGGYSLANLVSQFCGVKLDKKYQTADWRERPLPTDMIYYARADTHYLLFCFDCLKNALLAQSGMASTSGVNLGIPTLERGDVQATDEGVQALQTVMQQSAALCAQAYREAPLDAGELAQGLCKRFGSKQPLETKQLNTLKALAEWRDQLARNMDESSNHVAPDSCLWRICLAMPTSPVKLRSTCNPLPAILQQHAQEVVDIVVKCSQGQTPLELTAREPARPEPRVEEPAVEEEAQELVMKQDWPTRSPEASPRPLVHITATFAGTREVQCKRKWSVLCGFDSASEEPRDSEQSRPQKRARVIRRKLSFGVSAPAVVTAAVPDSASAVLQATVRDLSSASQAEAPSQEGPSDPQAEPGEPGELGELGEGQGEPEMPVPLRKRKRKRRATASLEQLVAAPAAKAATPVAMTSAWPDCGQFHLQKAAKAAASPVKPAAKATTPVAKTSVEPVSQAAKAAASPVKPAAKATTPVAKTSVEPVSQAAKAAASPVKPAAKATTPVAKTSVEPVSQAAKAAASPVKPTAKATTPVAKTSVEPVSQAAKAAASPVKPVPAEPKKKRRKVLKRVQAPVVDPYL